MGLRSAFALRRVLLSQGCASYCRAVLARRQGQKTARVSGPPASRLGVPKALGGDTAGTAEPH